jgi:hypothetical protein
MRTTDRTRKLFPVILKPIQKEMLSCLAAATGCSRGEVIRRLILRECATSQLAHHDPKAATRTEATP